MSDVQTLNTTKKINIAHVTISTCATMKILSNKNKDIKDFELLIKDNNFNHYPSFELGKTFSSVNKSKPIINSFE